MRFIILLVLVLGGIGLILGCADKEKEAAEMERQMSDEVVDPVIADSVEPPAEPAVVPEEAATEPAAKPPEFSAPIPSGEGYTVQVESCEDPAYAEHLIGLYAKRGYEAYVTTITLEDQTYYRVRIGNFPSVTEAKVLRAELIDKYSASPWVDRLDQ